MGLTMGGIGVIAFVCSRCGARLYWYVIGDGPEDSRSKYTGPPTPQRALSGFDRGECPVCGSRLSARPRSIRIMTLRDFEERYVATEYQVLPRSMLGLQTLPGEAEAET